MKNEQLIIDLIQQDLKHSQLLYGLESIGLDGLSIYHLAILEVIYQLMNVPKEKINDYLAETYASFMNRSIDYDITSDGQSLQPLAKECYSRLKYLIDL